MATSYTWTGSTSTNWATSTNWSPNGIPGATDNVTIVTGSNQVYLDMTRSVTNYTMSSGTFNLQTYTFNVTGTFQSNVGTILLQRCLQTQSFFPEESSVIRFSL